jgi:hypothetical protein
VRVASRVVIISNSPLISSMVTSQFGITGTALGIILSLVGLGKYFLRPWLSLGVGTIPPSSPQNGFALRLTNRSVGIAKGISVSIAIKEGHVPRYVMQGVDLNGGHDGLLLFLSRPMLPPARDLSEFVFRYEAPPTVFQGLSRPAFPLQWERTYEITAEFKDSNSLIAREANFRLELGTLNTDLPRLTAIHWRKLRHFFQRSKAFFKRLIHVS